MLALSSYYLLPRTPRVTPDARLFFFFSPRGELLRIILSEPAPRTPLPRQKKKRENKGKENVPRPLNCSDIGKILGVGGQNQIDRSLGYVTELALPQGPSLVLLVFLGPSHVRTSTLPYLLLLLLPLVMLLWCTCEGWSRTMRTKTNKDMPGARGLKDWEEDSDSCLGCNRLLGVTHLYSRKIPSSPPPPKKDGVRPSVPR